MGSEGFTGNDLRASLLLSYNDLVLTLDLDTRVILCFDCQTSMSRWSFCPFKLISPGADFSSLSRTEQVRKSVLAWRDGWMDG